MKNKNKRGVTIALMLIGIIILAAVLWFAIKSASNDSDYDGNSDNITEDVQQDTSTTDGENSSEQTENKQDEDTAQNDEGNTSEKTPDLVSGEDVKELVQEDNEAVEEGNIKCTEFSIFSGQFVEDGKDELVQNVAAMLVTNHSDKFLEFATLQYEIDGKEAYFVVTGLHAGQSAWVMEKSRLTIGNDAKFTYIGCVDSFRDDVVKSTDKIDISTSVNMMTVKNNTDKTLKDVCVYYKVKHTDGKYLGGITYVVNFGELKRGESLEKLAGHYDEEKAEVVRISFNEG